MAFSLNHTDVHAHKHWQSGRISQLKWSWLRKPFLKLFPTERWACIDFSWNSFILLFSISTASPSSKKHSCSGYFVLILIRHTVGPYCLLPRAARPWGPCKRSGKSSASCQTSFLLLVCISSQWDWDSRVFVHHTQSKSILIHNTAGQIHWSLSYNFQCSTRFPSILSVVVENLKQPALKRHS